LKKFVQQKNPEKKILIENYFDRKNEVFFFDMLSKSIFKLFEKKVKKNVPWKKNYSTNFNT